MLDKFKKYQFKNKYTHEEYLMSMGVGVEVTKELIHSTHFIQGSLSNVYKATPNRDSYTITVKCLRSDTDDTFIFMYLNDLGYYVSHYTKDGVLIPSEGYTGDYDGFIFSPKYNIQVVDYDKYVYHIVDRANIQTILSEGITSTTRTRLRGYSDRVFLIQHRDLSPENIDTFISESDITDPVLLRINTSGIPNLFIRDPEFKYGIYAPQNISTEFIEIIEVNDINLDIY